MNTASKQTPLSEYPAWRYRRTDELRSRFTLQSYQEALKLAAGLIELAEELEQQPTFSLIGRHISVQIAVPEKGLCPTLEEFVKRTDRLLKET